MERHDPQQARSTAAGDERPGDPLARFVERFALVLAESGMQRMAARIFAFMLASDADRHTAGDLARGLRVSPAAVSSAVRYLGQAELIVREREPGSRSDHYRLHDDVWSETYLQRIGQLSRWQREIDRAIEELDGPGPGQERLRESRAFLAFLREEMPELIERWRQRRAELAGERRRGA